ncbi:MAG: PQQ-binding-like beta-propeller repeat protein [Myxococcales bacterium]|nr:PQQ-binding-like beta-propeller repeat protein [Myxococcales bacterium]
MGAVAAAEHVPIGRRVALTYGVSRLHPNSTVGGDGRRSGRSPLRAPRAKPERRWATTLPQRRLLSPAVRADGTLLIASAGGLHALSADGRSLFFAPVGPLRHTPSLTPRGDALVSTYEGRLLLVGRAGESRPIFDEASRISMPLMLDGGALVVGGRDGQVQVLDLDGSILLSLPVAAREASFTADLGGGRALAGGAARELTVLSLHGGREAPLLLEEVVARAVAVDDRGGLWVVGVSGTLFGLEADGRVRVRVDLGPRAMTTAPVVDREGGTCVGLAVQEVRCYDRDGRERFRRGSDGRPGELLLDADDNLLFTTSRGILYCIDREGELRWTFPTTARGALRPVLGSDGSVIVVSDDGRVQALK